MPPVCHLHFVDLLVLILVRRGQHNTHTQRHLQDQVKSLVASLQVNFLEALTCLATLAVSLQQFAFHLKVGSFFLYELRVALAWGA